MTHIFSATQIKTYEMCARKWAWQYVDGLRPPQNKFAQFGTDTHTHLENWLQKRAVPPEAVAEGRAAQALIPHLPSPQSIDPNNVERKIDFNVGALQFTGKIDLWVPGSAETPAKVYDHKTTTSFDWALKPERMAQDVQATLYAYWAMLEQPLIPGVELHWNYALSRGKARTLPVVQTVTGRMIQERVSCSFESAREALLIKQSGARAIDVPYDATACGAFGGCPFRSNCNLPPEINMESMMSQTATKENYIEMLRNRKNGAAGITPPAPAAPAPAAVAAAPAPATSTDGLSPAEKLKASMRARSAAAATPAATPAAAPAPAPAAAPPPAEAAPAAEAPRRGPGRPRKETADANPDAEVWAAFARIALGVVGEKVGFDEFADADAREGVLGIVTEMADRLLVEHKTRFSAS